MSRLALRYGRHFGVLAVVLMLGSAGCSKSNHDDDDDDDGSSGESGAPSGAGGHSASGGSSATGGAGGSGNSGASGGSGGHGGSGGSSGIDASGGAGASTGGSGGEAGSPDGSGGTGGSTAGTLGGGSGGTGASGDAGAGGEGASDCIIDGFFLCDCLPSFGSNIQTLDGAADDFAGVPPMTFEVSELPYLSPSYPTPVPAEVTVRAAWTDQAFVAHVHVTDPLILPDASYTHWNGDNLQFFVAGTSLLTGAYAGIEDGGATHVIIAPPTETIPAQGITIYEPCYACVTVTELDAAAYATRLVADGYEVEVRLPWGATAMTRSSGMRIGLDFIFGVANTAGLGLQLEGALKNDPTLVSESCAPTPTTHPGCDDRVWCMPRLE